MATLTQTALTGPGQRTCVLNTLTASDTFAYTQGAGQELVLINNTAGALTPTIGSGAASIAVPGIPSVSVTSYSVGSIAIGAAKCIPLDTISAFLVNGTIAMTNGVGLTAIILNPQL